MADYYNIDGEPIDMMEWARLFEIPEYRIVASDMVGHVWISTVWLGLDHNWLGSEPWIFETIAFVVPQGDDRWKATEIRRYATHAQALEGHAQVLGLIREIESTQTGETDDNRTDQGTTPIHDHLDRGGEA